MSRGPHCESCPGCFRLPGGTAAADLQASPGAVPVMPQHAVTSAIHQGTREEKPIYKTNTVQGHPC